MVYCDTLLRNLIDIRKCDSYLITKCDKTLLQNASDNLLENRTVITKYNKIGILKFVNVKVSFKDTHREKAP